MADSVVTVEGQAMDRADIIRAIREADRIKDFNDKYESASLSRMNGLGVKLGEMKNERIMKSSRRDGSSTKNKYHQLPWTEEDIEDEIGALMDVSGVDGR